MVQSGRCKAVDRRTRYTQFEISAADKIFDGRELFGEIREIHTRDGVGDSVMRIQRTEIIHGTKIRENKELLIIEIELAVAPVSESFDAF